MIGGLTSAAIGSELEGSRSTSVTVPADHIGAALTLTPAGITHGAKGALRITVAFWEMYSNTTDMLDNNQLQQHKTTKQSVRISSERR